MVYAIQRAASSVALPPASSARQQFTAWSDMFDFYVALRGHAEDELANEVRGKLGKGFEHRGKESKSATGRESLSASPLHMAVVIGQESIMRSEKNRVDKRLLTLAQQNPNEEEWHVYSPGGPRLQACRCAPSLATSGEAVKVPDLCP
jgi:hypothetical protein